MIQTYIALLQKVLRYSPDYLKRVIFLLKKGKIKNAYNYLWTFAFTKEEGLALLEPIYLKDPSRVPYPERIEIEPTNRCVFRCLKCEHTYWNEKNKDMTFEQFKHIVDQFPNLKACSPTGISDQFLNKDYLKMLRYLKSKGIFVNIFDHFFHIKEEIARELIDISVDRIWMSIDAATKETYEKLMVGLDFEKVTTNLKNFIKLKREMKSPLPEICFHFIVTKDNYREMPEFLDLVRSLTVEDNSSYHLVQFTRLIPFKENELLAPPEVIPEEIMKEVEDKARKCKIRLDCHNIPKKLDCPIRECTAWNVPFFTVDGDVYPCCALTERNMRSLIKKHVFGNIFEKSFKEIWCSKEFRNFVQMIHENRVPFICEGCAIYKTRLSSMEFTEHLKRRHGG